MTQYENLAALLREFGADCEEDPDEQEISVFERGDAGRIAQVIFVFNGDNTFRRIDVLAGDDYRRVAAVERDG